MLLLSFTSYTLHVMATDELSFFFTIWKKLLESYAGYSVDENHMKLVVK